MLIPCEDKLMSITNLAYCSEGWGILMPDEEKLLLNFDNPWIILFRGIGGF